MSTVRSGSGAAVAAAKSAMRGERRGGKDGGEGKPAKRGEGQVRLLRTESGRDGGTNAHKAPRAASPPCAGI